MNSTRHGALWGPGPSAAPTGPAPRGCARKRRRSCHPRPPSTQSLGYPMQGHTSPRRHLGLQFPGRLAARQVRPRLHGRLGEPPVQRAGNGAARLRAALAAQPLAALPPVGQARQALQRRGRGRGRRRGAGEPRGGTGGGKGTTPEAGAQSRAPRQAAAMTCARAAALPRPPPSCLPAPLAASWSSPCAPC